MSYSHAACFQITVISQNVMDGLQPAAGVGMLSGLTFNVFLTLGDCGSQGCPGLQLWCPSLGVHHSSPGHGRLNLSPERCCLFVVCVSCLS